VERFAPLAEHLTRELGRPVEVFSATEYLGVILAMQNGQVDIGYFGPKSYVEASRVAGAVAVAKQLELDGTPGYFSVILTRAGLGIASIEEARGRVFGFVSPSSTSGYLVPAIGLVERTGQRAEDYFGEVRYTGNHATSVRAVLAGDLDLAATNTLDLAAMRASGLDDSALVELWRSELIPGSVIAVRKDMPDVLRERVRAAVVGFSFGDAASMARGGYVPAHDHEYDVIRVLEEREAELAAAGG
jgi:phosphonate transport system substrate-binding protein